MQLQQSSRKTAGLPEYANLRGTPGRSARTSVLPLDQVPVLKQASLCPVAGCRIPATAMTLSVPPFAVVAPSVWPAEYTGAVLDILEEVAFVAATIAIAERPLAVHRVPLPLTSVSAPIRPVVRSSAAHVVGLKSTIVL